MHALDSLYMRRALTLARAQLGRTAPNPAVGCVLVRDGRVLGEGATGVGGRPHAEEFALAAAGEAAGATAYVTLEPCARRSQGELSCTDRLRAAGVSRVCVALEDPHPNASGAGLAALRAAGVAVEIGLEQAAAAAVAAGFVHKVRTGLPLAEISDDPTGYDAALELLAGETLEAALARLGHAGLTRVYAAPGTVAARAIAASCSDAD